MVQSEEIKLDAIYPSDQAINFIFGVYSDPQYISSYPDTERTFAAVYSMIKAWENGAVSFWGAFHGEDILALFHGHEFNNYQFEIHQLVIKKFWGMDHWPLQVEASNIMAETIFEKYPKVRQITGFTPMDNPLAIKFAKRASFVKVGEMPEYFDKGGEMINAAIMVRRRAS